MLPSLSTAELIVLDALYDFALDDNTLMPMPLLDKQCKMRGLTYEEGWAAVDSLIEAGLLESEIKEYGIQFIWSYGFTDRTRAGEILFANPPLSPVGPRSRPSSLADRLLSV